MTIGSLLNKRWNIRCVRKSKSRLISAYLVVVMIVGVFFVSAFPVHGDEAISIASWNIRNVSDKSRSDAELGIISLILFRYDFVALQEVIDETVIKRVQRILKEDFCIDYEFVVSAQVGRNKKERYAFLWRKDKVESISEARIYPDSGDRFERDPYCGMFKAGKFDWKICTIHVLYGDSEAARRPELAVLDDVYRDERDSGNEKDVLICGDFNFDPEDEGWAELKAEDGFSFAIGPPIKTTIEDKSLYDNCWWPKSTLEIVEGSGSVFEFDELMYPLGARKEANRLTSDHRPISIRARTDMPDDD